MGSDDREKYVLLAQKWLKGNLTRDEEEAFNNWYNTFPQDFIEIELDTAKSENQLKERLLEEIKLMAGITASKKETDGDHS